MGRGVVDLDRKVLYIRGPEIKRVAEPVGRVSLSFSSLRRANRIRGSRVGARVAPEKRRGNVRLEKEDISYEKGKEGE